MAAVSSHGLSYSESPALGWVNSAALRCPAAGSTPLLEAPGHTPHSAVVLISDGDEQLLYASDATLLPVQNALRPDWVSAFEMDGPALVAARHRLLDRAATDGLLWHGYHASFPALGRIRRDGDAYAWVPANCEW